MNAIHKHLFNLFLEAEMQRPVVKTFEEFKPGTRVRIISSRAPNAWKTGTVVGPVRGMGGEMRILVRFEDDCDTIYSKHELEEAD